MTNLEQVQEIERIDRLITTQIFNNLFDKVEYDYKEERYNNIDMCCTAYTSNKSATFDVEIKYRNYKQSTFHTTILECDKYNSLLQSDNKYKVYVVIFPKSDCVYFFRLDKIDFSTVQQSNFLLPKETLSEDGEMKRKACYLIPFSCGAKFDFDCFDYYT
jgi:hypothetical protein